MNKEEISLRNLQILKCMSEDARISFTDISKKLDVPVSTVYDVWERLKGDYVFVMIPRNVLKKNHLFLAERKEDLGEMIDLSNKKGDINVNKAVALLMHE